MTTMTTLELGNIGSEEQAKKIYNLLNGKSYMNFIVSYSNCAGNWPVDVSTEYKDITIEDLNRMVLFVMASEL